jgi:carbon monoxide dehydrogenase subunit G
MLNDPDVLAQAIPAASELVAEGPDRYRVEATAGVGFFEVHLTGRIELLDKVEPESYRMAIDGSGSAGTVKGSGVLRLTELSDAETMARFDLEVEVGGLVARAGEKALLKVADSLIARFFDGVETQVAAYVDK